MANNTTRKEIDAFYAKIQPGMTLRCTENTYIPDRVGIERQVVFAAKGFLEMTDGHGKQFVLRKPTRVRDVAEVTDTSITYYLTGTRTDGHRVSWEIVQ